MSISRQLDRRPTTYMKWLVHDLLKGEHDDIPPQRSPGQLTGAPVDAGTYSFEPTPVHIVIVSMNGRDLGLGARRYPPRSPRASLGASGLAEMIFVRT